MKKWGIVCAVIAVAALVGCASSGGSGGGGASGDAYTVDLSACKVVELGDKDAIGAPTGETVRNPNPFQRNYDNLLILFPEFPVDVTKFSRVTIRAKYFNSDGGEIIQGDGNAMVSLIEDVTKDMRGGAGEGVYANIPLKQYNVGGFSGPASTDRGSRIKLSMAPQGILFQNSNPNVKFIELTEVTFHND
ncbi:MAG: hypothetical protein FWF55_06050 [Treponema sp.]|nr:hypothetical protein [Treponema sp.]